MSDDVSDLSLEQMRRELISLRRESNAYSKTVDRLLKDLNLKNEEIKHLQSLVSQVVPVIKPAQEIVVAPEEDIASTQLERLRASAKTRALTLEEIRAYDLLVKNKRLSQDKSTENVTQSSYRDVSEIDLVKALNEPKKS